LTLLWRNKRWTNNVAFQFVQNLPGTAAFYLVKETTKKSFLHKFLKRVSGVLVYMCV